MSILRQTPPPSHHSSRNQWRIALPQLRKARNLCSPRTRISESRHIGIGADFGVAVESGNQLNTITTTRTTTSSSLLASPSNSSRATALSDHRLDCLIVHVRSICKSNAQNITLAFIHSLVRAAIARAAMARVLVTVTHRSTPILLITR